MQAVAWAVALGRLRNEVSCVCISSSASFVLETWSAISDEKTFDVPYYHPEYSVANDTGTSHISVLSPEGDAVAVTTYVCDECDYFVHA